MKKTKSFVVTFICTVLLVSNVCYAGTWHTMRIGPTVTRQYTSSTFVSNGDVSIDLGVWQATSTVSAQASSGTVEFQRLDSLGNWVTVDRIANSLFKGSTSLRTHFGKIVKTLHGTCRIVFTSDKSVRIEGNLQYFT